MPYFDNGCSALDIGCSSSLDNGCSALDVGCSSSLDNGCSASDVGCSSVAVNVVGGAVVDKQSPDSI